MGYKITLGLVGRWSCSACQHHTSGPSPPPSEASGSKSSLMCLRERKRRCAASWLICLMLLSDSEDTSLKGGWGEGDEKRCSQLARQQSIPHCGPHTDLDVSVKHQQGACNHCLARPHCRLTLTSWKQPQCPEQERQRHLSIVQTWTAIPLHPRGMTAEPSLSPMILKSYKFSS